MGDGTVLHPGDPGYNEARSENDRAFDSAVQELKNRERNGNE
jgi:hypothetical protein